MSSNVKYDKENVNFITWLEKWRPDVDSIVSSLFLIYKSTETSLLKIEDDIDR